MSIRRSISDSNQQSAPGVGGRTLVPWEQAAEGVCKIVGTRVGAVAREVAEQFYTEIMESTQDYLAENVAYNLKSELDAARGRAERAEKASVDLLRALQELRNRCEGEICDGDLLDRVDALFRTLSESSS
ncbi:hypothetical protein [Afipia sp. DC4300-2b1]|uniref:hypothetical protein n=1 Tax=Afipia sp. DC4300-2b1 TaxID=2804672 RepID=UPI003CF8FF96